MLLFLYSQVRQAVPGCMGVPLGRAFRTYHYNSEIIRITMLTVTKIKFAELSSGLGRLWRPSIIGLEQAVETGSPETLDVVAAHRQSLHNAAALFAGW